MSAVLKPAVPEPLVLTVPDDGEIIYPTLGPLVCDWMEAYLVFGPGDMRGEPYVLDDEARAYIYRCYELHPPDHPQAGRRRFRRCALSLPKGLRKTELMAAVAAAELHQDAPVRFDGWDGQGEPLGRPVDDPFIVLVAYTEEQSDELAYGALRSMIDEGPLARDFDVGLERIMRRTGDGKAVSLAGSPSARDGARTTFQGFDETHWHTSDKLRRAHQTMMANLPKRKRAQAWALEVTTAFEPGAVSIAETTYDYAKAISEGRHADTGLFFYHRQANPRRDLQTEAGARAAVIDATGETALEWRDVEAIIDLWRDPTTDRRYWQRVWCNWPVQSATRAFDIEVFRAREKDVQVALGSMIALGFDGSQRNDATALVATDVLTGHQWVCGLWEKPVEAGADWKVPAADVDDCVAQAFEDYNVWRLYADPPYWQSWIAKWQGEYGDDRVIEWETYRRRQMAAALEGYETAIREGSISHDGNEDLVRHVGNAHRHDLPHRDDEARPRWLIRKDRADSPYKIDAAMASVLSWEARTDAIASGVLTQDGPRLDAKWVQYWSTPPEGGNRYILVMPANEKRSKSAYTAMWVFEAREDQAYYALEIVRDRLDLGARVELLLQLHRKHHPLAVGYQEYGLEADRAQLEARHEQANYRFHVTPLGEALPSAERIKRLAPLFEAGRIVLPKTHLRTLHDGREVDMVEAFLREEYIPYPMAAHTELLDTASRILDLDVEFPSTHVWQPPTVFPSEF